MLIQDNVIRSYLKNVYFILGTACGGKTTISRALAKKHNFLLYDEDERFSAHQAMSNPTDQPAMNRTFPNADAFFGRSVPEYAQWLLDNTREQLDFIMLDLIRLSAVRPVVCDLHLTLEQAALWSDPSRVAFLIREPSNIIEEYCNRPDHADFAAYINGARDPVFAKENCQKTLAYLNGGFYRKVRESSWFWIERTETSTVPDTLRRVEEHFGL